MNKLGKFIGPSPFAASGAARCGPEAGQSHMDFRVAFLPKIRASMNVKDQMKNTKWWYSIYFRIDFILHLAFSHFREWCVFRNGRFLILLAIALGPEGPPVDKIRELALKEGNV